ncbi:MAG TPA: Ig-like domain-containing protein [Candidatus Polarisedimenticolia bacterium]|nr:Ig-like domain-containing protein [Candidatus Polarisedimenticolia bacterium]
MNPRFRSTIGCLAIATLLVGAVACGGAPAQIVDYSPLRGAKDVATLAPVVITFDHDVDRASVESRLRLVPAVSGSIKWKNGHQLEYQHEKLATAATYDVVLEAGYSDLSGNVYELRHHWSFDTEPPPRFAGSTPSDGDGAVDPADYLSLTFSRAMLESSLASGIVFTPEVRFGVRIDPSDSRRVIVAPDSLLQPNTLYRMLVTQIAKDADGNELDHVRSVSFKTGAARPLHHWVAFAAENIAGTSGGLWIVNETGIPRQLLESGAVNAYSWSPDGQRLTFETADGWATFAPGEGIQSLGFSATWAAALAPGLGYVYIDSAGSLYRAPQSGADYVLGTLVRTVAVSPSGERLVFAQDQPDGTTRIWGYDVGLRSRYVLASETTPVSDLSWAPNGNRIAYLRHDAGTVTLRVRNLTSSGALTSVVHGDLNAPTWLRDSDHVVMAAFVAGDSGAVSKAFVINVASPPPALTIGLGLPALPNVVDVSDPVPSPDGHQIAFISGDQVWLMNADGTRPTALTRFDAETFPYSCLMPAWTRV